MSRINIRKHRDPLRVLSEYYIEKYIIDGYVLLPKLYRHVGQIDEHRRREWVDTNPEKGELLLAFRQSKEDLIRMGVLK